MYLRDALISGYIDQVSDYPTQRALEEVKADLDRMRDELKRARAQIEEMQRSLKGG